MTAQQISATSTAPVGWQQQIDTPSGSLPSKRSFVENTIHQVDVTSGSSGPTELFPPTVQVIEPSVAPTEINDDEVLARLAPLDRWRVMAKRNKPEFFFTIAATLVAIIAIVLSASHLLPALMALFSWTAFAQDNNARMVAQGDGLEWVVMGLMSGILVWSILTVTWSKTASNVAFAKDTMKTIVGFIVGFLGGKGR